CISTADPSLIRLFDYWRASHLASRNQRKHSVSIKYKLSMRTVEVTDHFSSLVLSKIKAYAELIKLRLSALVTFSAVFGYILGDRGASFGWSGFLGLALGGFLISGASC